MAEPRAESTSDKVAHVVRARLLSSLVDVGLGVALVHLLPKGEFAALSLLLFLFQLAKQFAVLGLPESIYYFFGTLRTEQHRPFALQTLGLMSAIAVVAGLGLAGLGWTAPLWLPHWEPAHVSFVQMWLPWIGLVAALEFPTWMLIPALIGSGRARQGGAYQLLTTVLVFVATVIPILLGYGAGGAVVGLVLYAVLRFVLTVVWLLRALAPGHSHDSGQARLPQGSLQQQLAFGIPLGLNALANRLNKYIDKGVVTLMLPAAALAEYTTASYEVPFVSVIPYAVGSVLITRYVVLQKSGDMESLRQLWYRAIHKVALAVLPSTVALLISAPVLVPLVFGSQYAGAVVPFQILLAVLLQRVAHYGAVLQAFGQTKSILRYTLAGLCTNAILSVPLTWTMGIVGTALGTLVASMVAFALYLRACARHLEVPWWKVIPALHYTRVLVASVLAAACGSLVLYLPYLVAVWPSALRLGGFVGVVSVLYPVLARALHAWLPDDTQSLKQLAGIPISPSTNGE